jgi:hypothetical protein
MVILRGWVFLLSEVPLHLSGPCRRPRQHWTRPTREHLGAKGTYRCKDLSGTQWMDVQGLLEIKDTHRRRDLQ